MSRIVILGEGVEDIGRVTVDERFIDCDFEGDLPRLLRRLVEDAGGRGRFGYEVEAIGDLVKRIPRTGAPARGGGKAKDLRDAVLSYVRAEKRPAAVIAVIDARIHEVAKLRHEIANILRQSEAYAPDVLVAIGLAIQEIEIWMLADPKSRQAAFGAIGEPEPISVELEQAEDPKSLWRGLAGRVPCPEGVLYMNHHDELRRAAWASLRPTVVAQACPLGFKPFSEQAISALGFLLPCR